MLRVSIIITIIVLLVLLYAEFRPLPKKRKPVNIYHIESKVLPIKKTAQGKVLPFRNRYEIIKEDENDKKD